MKKDIKIILFCLKSADFCCYASKIMTPIPTNSDTMQKTYEGLSRMFLSFGKDFDIIANMAGFTDLTEEKRKIILEKINNLPELNKVQRRKCLKEISTLIS